MYNVFGVTVLFVFDVIAPTLFLQLTGNNIPETELVDSE
jgi:hypothetical protein